MHSHENIQSKIDLMIKEANSMDAGSQKDDYNNIKILLYYNHCVDILEFLKLYSKVQLNELLVKVAIIYDLLGNSQLSLEIIDESLKIISNVPSAILFKSGLFVTMNKLDEAQKCLLKFKYLIGEDPYSTYIYNTFRILYYYLLEYEENIILREINLVEKQFPEYYNNDVVLHFLKSKICHKLSEKFKNADKNRSCLYKRDSFKNKEIVFKSRRLDAEYLYKYGINKEKFTKIVSIVDPSFINYKPKTLVEYNSNFKSGFRLFFTLFEITKIIKLKILIKKQKKLSKNNITKNNFLNKNNGEKNIINSNTKIKISSNEPLNDNEVEKCHKLISSFSKSVWLQRYTYGINIIYRIENKQIKEKESMKNIDINNINYKLKTNYYIYEGYYSMMNLKDVIIKNIDFKNKLKDVEDSFSIKLKEDFEQIKNIKENDYNIITKENITKKDDNNISKTKSNQNELKGHNIFQNGLIQSTKNKNKINIDINIKNSIKDKSLRISTETSNNNPINLEKEKEKRKRINNLEIITDKIQLDINEKINSVEKDLIYLTSNRKVINTKNTSNDNTINDSKKKQTKIDSIKSFNKNKNENNNIFTNATLGTKSLYTLINFKKNYLYTNKDKNKKKTISKIERKRSKEKEKNVSSVKVLDKHQEIYNEISLNNKNNSNKNIIYRINSQQNNAIKDLAKYIKKKDDHSNNKNTIINEKVAGKNFNKYLKKNEKELKNTILERRVKKRNNAKPLMKKIKEKYLDIDTSPYNTFNVKNSFNNSKKYISQMNSININKLLINNYYYKIKTYTDMKETNISQRSENKKKKKDNFLTIALTSIPKTITSTPTYKKLSMSSSSKADSKDKKKKNNRIKIRYKK